MTPDDRLTSALFLDVLDVLERHGYHHHDKQHTGQALGVIRDLAHVYEGTREAPYGTYLDQAPPEPQADQGATCADCTDRSCGTCQWRLQTAGTYSRMADQMTQTAEASQAAVSQPETVSHPQPPADKEAGR
jgi:hypothetical protein